MSTPVDIDPKEFVSTLEFLKQIDFFQGVPEEALRSLLFSIQKVSVAKQKTLLFQGEIANQLCIIKKGSVIITTKHKGTKIQLAELVPPSYFGEISLLRPTAATATVTSGEEGTEMLVISHETLDELVKKIPDIINRIQQIIDARLASKQKAKDKEETSS